MAFKLRRKKSKTEVALHEVVQKELQGYLRREELQGYLEKIRENDKRRKLWDSLSSRKKIKVLRFVLEKKGKHGKE